MRLGFARIVHRSNSFASFITNYGHFQDQEFLSGGEIVERYSGAGVIAGGVIAATEQMGIELIPLLSTRAQAGGPVEHDFLGAIADLLVEKIRTMPEEIDGLILEMSGAMTSTEGDSGDERIVAAVRREFPELVMVLALSAQANITREMAGASDIIVSNRSIPATDSMETGQQAVERIEQLLESGNGEYIALERLPLLIPIAAQRTDSKPMYDLVRSLVSIEGQEDVAGVSLFCGFPYADSAHSGASIVVSSRRDASHASELAARLRDDLWNRRSDFYVEGSNVEEAVHVSMASRSGTVLIADLGDNPDDGAPGDGTTVLWALMDLGVRNATLGTIADEQAVEVCVRAGVNARVEIPVGGRRDTRHGYPIDIRAKVRSIHHGRFRLNGPINAELDMDAGRIVVLDVEARHDGHVELILSEKSVQITDTSLFSHVGIDPAKRKIISIKSAGDYRPEFTSIASAIYEVITPGITTPDPSFYEYQKVRRPIFPLDPI